MRTSKHLLKKIHLTEKSFRRGLSFLLSLCMVASLFVGMVPFSASAQGAGARQTQSQEKTQSGSQGEIQTQAREESRAEIKARLLRQIKDEGWDPYSSDMSLDEFYALMEMFQEGTLPLADEDSVAEEIPVAKEPTTDKPTTEGPTTDKPTIDEPTTDEPTTDEPTIDEPTIGEPTIDEPTIDEPTIDEPTTDKPTIDEPTIDEPTTDKPTIEGPSFDAPASDDPDSGEGDDPTPAQPITHIPREMFLFSGLNYKGKTDENDEDISSGPGTYRTYDKNGNVTFEQNLGSPLDYDSRTGAEDEPADYPAGLDPYGTYTRPPMGWPGLKIDSNSLSAAIVVPGINDGNTSVSGDVDQKLFLEYKGVYIRRVTAQNNDVNVLGAIQPPNSGGKWVYYYTTRETQSTQVSATTLPEGEKFVIHYAHEEYSISYQIRFRATEEELGTDGHVNLFGYDLVGPVIGNGEPYYDKFINYQKTFTNPDDADIADFVRQLPRLADETQRGELAEAIFGTEFPTKTDEGRYAFTATAPAGYTLAFYLSDSMKDTNNDGQGDTWSNGKAMLVTPEGFTGEPGEYTGVNQGWALGMEPVYYHNGLELVPDEEQGPQELLTTGTFSNNDVQADRIVVAVLRKKADPEFDAWSHLNEVKKDGSPGGGYDENVGGRGSNAVRTVTATNRATGEEEKDIPYDYEDEYLWWKYKDLSAEEFEKLDDSLKSKYINYNNRNLPGNLQTGDDWNWNNTKNDTNRRLLMQSPMTDEGDGTYSFQWTFQGNSNSGGFTLDTLEINRTGITIPFYAKYSEKSDTTEYLEDRDDSGGRFSWWAETTLPDGAVIKVEYLMIFQGNTPQRVYRISVRGATNNITITNMNLMMGTGAPEIAVYELDGVTGATSTGNIRRTAIQNFTNKGWSGNIAMGSVIVDGQDNGTKPGESDTTYSGDDSMGGANIRFKLASGYSSPAYLFEDREAQVIHHSGEDQASIERNSDLSLDRATQNPVVPYISDGSDPYMRYDESGVPYPVNKDGKELYYYNDNGQFVQFTDWTILRINADAVAGDVLVPALYLSTDRNTPLAKDQVIAAKRTCVFKFETENKNSADMPILKSQYIYSGTNGWYYIRLTGHENNALEKFALLTVVAFPTRYVVRYKPGLIPERTLADGTVIDAHPPQNTPNITHGNNCPTFFQGKKEDRPMEQFDDNGGDFYDIVTHTDVAINLTRPTDPEGHFRFVDWVLVDEYDDPIEMHYLDENGDWSTKDDGTYDTYQFHITSGSFRINDYVDHAIFNSDLGAVDDDIYVLRLMPTWERVENEYHYKVALNWVDARGVLHAEYFDDEYELWQEVLTDYDQDEGKGPTVKILTDAIPFQNWIAQHPTYTFWNAVNNATGSKSAIQEAVEAALTEYFPDKDSLTSEEQAVWEDNYQKALDAILNRDRKYGDNDKNADRYQAGDDFDPLGNYTYAVNEDYGTIVIWMYEDKGGLVFHKSVDAEPFIPDDEFYFTVKQIEVEYGDDQFLDGEYKAYPTKVYDEMTGRERAVRDSDAWLVTFKEGSITSIVKNDGSARPSTPVTYFTVKNGESIQLYVPGGTYTIAELGSKSGGSYRTEVTYVDADTGYEQVPKTGWIFPTDYGWLKGSEKTYKGSDDTLKDPNAAVSFPNGISQVSAKVNFVVGEHDVAHIINFSNQTSAVAIENLVIGPYQGEQLGYTVTLTLPAGATPLKSEDGSYYYFNFNLYDVTYPEGTEAKYKDEYFPENFTPPERVKPGLENYEQWWVWHNWRPDGTLSVNTTGRVVVEKASDGPNDWVAQYLLIPETGPTGIITGWRKSTYSGNGVIGLTSGQRFYVVCTVPDDSKDINYKVEESDTRGYLPGGGRPRVREGKAVAAELAYELFKNTKMQGLPATGGMGESVFRLAGLALLASGLGLVCVNRKERRRAGARPSDPA